MSLPKSLPDSAFEDLQELDNSIDNLFQTYITPIDRIRSKGIPILNSNTNTSSTNQNQVSDFANLQLSNKPLESRVHAFYRMIGLPVVAKDGSFYNPGFDPNGSASLNRRNKINDAINNNASDIETLSANREKLIKENSNLFAQQNINSSVYGLLLRFTYPFSLIKSSAPLEVDNQSYSITDRLNEANTLATNNNIFVTEINDTAQSVKTIQHVLKPFVVDYRLESTITPDYNKICVPFLKDKKSVKINSNESLLRPGIELIIRQRLADNTTDTNFLKAAQNILEGQNKNLFTSDVDSFTLQAEVNILSNTQNVSNNVQKMLSGVTSLQINNVNKLIKTIKIAIKNLFDACSDLDTVKSKINFCPIFGPDGPITGTVQASNRNNFKTCNTNIDLQIAELKIKKLNAERQVTEFTNLGDFASPFLQNDFSEKTSAIDDQINQLTNYKNRLFKDGVNDIRTIEIVKGEISGLGLVDILAIYTALWSLDLDTLLSLLDETAFSRMVNYNPQFLAISQVNNRKTLGAPIMDILTALTNLEKKVIQVLNFADIYFRNFQMQSPTVASNLSLEGIT
jgi:hypothetical protein